MNHDKAGCRRQLECLPADAQGPQLLGQLSGLLTRLGPARVGVVRQDGQDLGCEQWRAPADARGPQRWGQLGGLLTRLGPARVGVGRQDGQDLGCEQRRVPADAGCWQNTLQNIIRSHRLVSSH